MSARATYLLQSQVFLLNSWGSDLRRVFPDLDDEGPPPAVYLVGSVLERADFRDVDVRIMLPDAHYDRLEADIDLASLHLALSLWGQKVTGLPIDCQVQRTTDANDEFDGVRNPLGSVSSAARLAPKPRAA